MQDYTERRALRGELKLLAKEERSRQQKAVKECLSNAKVVCATLSGCLSRDLDPLTFDLAVVDEAAQVSPGHALVSIGTAPCCRATSGLADGPLANWVA